MSGPGAYQAAQSAQQSQPVHHQPAPQQYHQPAHHQPAPAHHQPAQQARPAPSQSAFAVGANSIVHVNVRGVPGAADKMKVVARQEDVRIFIRKTYSYFILGLLRVRP